MHKSIWERRGLFTSECRTDSCRFYVTQSCDVTQPITRPLPHSAVVTKMNLTQNPLPILFRAAFVTDTSADQQAKWQLTAEREYFGNLCEIWPSSCVKHILALSSHARPVCFHLNNSNVSQHLFPEMIQRSRQSVFWCVDLGVVFTCLSIAQ